MMMQLVRQSYFKFLFIFWRLFFMEKILIRYFTDDLINEINNFNGSTLSKDEVILLIKKVKKEYVPE